MSSSLPRATALEMSLHVIITRYLQAALGTSPLGNLTLALVGVDVFPEIGGAHLLVADRA